VMVAPVPRVVVVTRCTPYEALLERHATRGQAQFFLQTRGEDIESVEAAHRRFQRALGSVLQSIPPKWRRAQVDRRELDRFLFEPEDLIAVVGQDGLVANVAKYLDGQPVIGLNPLPDEYDGILVPHPPEAAPDLIAGVARGKLPIEHRTMAEAGLDDGQRLLALNEIFVGHRSHQSARYWLTAAGQRERHSSSGLIVATGTGATGWARSINLSRGDPLDLPGPEERKLAFFVREAFPSIATGVDLTCGVLAEREQLAVVSEMNEGGVIFGDGIEDDFLDFAWGQKLDVHVAASDLSLVAG
jgi:NAD kinase